MNKDYIYLTGSRDEYKLLYVFEDRCLYVKKCVRAKNVEWICYQTILVKKDKGQPKCTARVIIHPDGQMTRNKICHAKHCDHSIIRQDMDAVNTMKSYCDYVRTNFDSVLHKVSALDIFLQVMKK